ncbi:MAG: transcription-repair coupling factor [Termitinemataceae bacterium]|nr:MAG: transcription-repair coupling factor [Termitinemataceae bacterium]
MDDINIFASELTNSDVFRTLLQYYNNNNFPLEVYGVNGALHSIIVSSLIRSSYVKIEGDHKSLCTLIVVPTEREALALQNDLTFQNIKCELMPCWGTIPYRALPPFSAVFAERARLLTDLTCNSVQVVVASQRALLTPVPPPAYTKKLALIIRVGETLDTVALSKMLSAWAWTRVQRVQMSGEFVVHGEVMDIFCSKDNAYRVLLDFDKVESIKKIDITNQTTISAVDGFAIHPQKEIIWDDTLIETLSNRLAAMPEMKNGGKQIIEQLITKKAAEGEEYFFPLLFEEKYTILDYMHDANVMFFQWERLQNSKEVLEKEYQNLYRSVLSSGSAEKEVPQPKQILLNFNEIIKKIKRKIYFCSIRPGTENKNELPQTTGSAVNFNSLPEKSYLGNVKYMKEDFAALLQNGYKIIVSSESEAQVLRFKELLKDLPEVQTIISSLSGGFSIDTAPSKFMLVVEREIFARSKRPRSLQTAKSSALDTFVELNPGDYVVHINYGIGLFKGIERITALGQQRDYIKLEYAESETVFIPIEQVNLVQRYIGNEGAKPRLDVLGSKSWSERKARAKKAAQDLANKLLDIYAKRESSVGFAYPHDTEWQTMFEAAFPYEETEDQIRCVEEIKADMESSRPMDRLVCGDVGYGKTEVALRACFKAVMGGKQTAFLVPTTILAQQHYNSFTERFKNFPVKVALLSRFVEKRVMRQTIDALKKGQIDIIVGTHRIIQNDLVFKDLGLIVIDEEQRFGVKDKEKLKAIKHNVDCLSLSATPIPRTLHMSLIKIRDMSILATPPQNRRPIETVINEYDDEKVAKAIRAEVTRGGQVFFLHNRIESLEEVRLRLQRLMPEMLIEIAHGRMDSTELEDIMNRFINGGFHILLSTTIIENGIDIPNVNTMIIDRADMYGVSQLYQLRGRVGRSDKTAYAYLFYPADTAINEIAMKRLSVISDFTDLGSGFKIAMKDMEIRGAGNLLGREQSGAIYSVGFDLYMRLLEEAIQRLQKENYETETEPLLELEYSGFIPDTYINGAQEKMDLYKKIAAVSNNIELECLQNEISDRFGPPPLELVSLLSLAEIRIVCKELSILSLKERKGIVEVQFTKVSNINVDKLIKLMQASSGKIKINPKMPNMILLQTGKIDLKEKSEYIKANLKSLQGTSKNSCADPALR